MDVFSNKNNLTLEQVHSGQAKIAWAAAHMPVLGKIAAEFTKTKPLSGFRISVSVHVEAKTACLARTLEQGGADVALTGCNPLSTQDDVAAALAAGGMQVYCAHGVDSETYHTHLIQALSIRPHIIIDDGGDFAQVLHTERKDLALELIGGCEETTTGVNRLKILSRDGKLLYPALAVNDARCKHLFDNRYGTGQSVWTAIMSVTNLLIAGKTVVIAGFGMCGKGVALRGRALGARIIITEIDPVKACEALMEGYEVRTMAEAAKQGDLFITVTGCRDVITKEHYPFMKNGAILCNAGHFNVEININQLEDLSESHSEVRSHITSYRMQDGREIQLLAQGRLVNLAAGDGHPAEIMDMSFSLQALSVKYLAEHGRKMQRGVYDLPANIDNQVALYLLDHLEHQIDRLTPDQSHYLSSWDI